MASRDEFLIVFEGQEASRNRLPAALAGDSLIGIVNAIQRVEYYIEFEKVRQRGPYSRNFDMYLEHTRPGSFEVVLAFVLNAGLEVTKELLKDGIRTVFDHVLGRGPKPETDAVKTLIGDHPGDFLAVGDSVRAPLRQAHRIINSGAGNITIIQGDVNLSVFTPTTKAFLNRSDLTDEIEFQLGSVGAYNANDKKGRIFLASLGHLVTFDFFKEIEEGTMDAITWSLSRYASGRDSDIRIGFKRLLNLDGDTLAVRIQSAERIDIDREGRPTGA